jgi:hypothetical protein
MAYAEFLRARKSLAWHAAILAALTLAILYFAGDSHVHIDGSVSMTSGMALPLSQLAPIGMFFAAIFASSQGASLNRENATRDISWTKPVPRSVLALQYIAIDVAVIVIAFVLTMLAVAIVLLRAHVTPVVDPEFATLMILGAGVAVMWYALIQLLTFWFPAGARSIAGIIWPVALLALGLARVHGPLGAVTRAIDVINPLAYMSGVQFSSNGTQQQAITTLPLELRPLAVWLFAALFCAIVVTLWPKKEA